MEELRFPTLDYYLDESDPDVVIVCRISLLISCKVNEQHKLQVD